MKAIQFLMGYLEYRPSETLAFNSYEKEDNKGNFL